MVHRASVVGAVVAVLVFVAVLLSPLLDGRVPSDVLIVTIDTARADHFSYTGESQVATPVIDALAREGVGFLRAIAPAPITLVSHSSLFTGKNPTGHGVRNNGIFYLPDDLVTLAELLREQDFATGAFVGAGVLGHKYGLDQGFDVYDDKMVEGGLRSWTYDRRTGLRVIDATLLWLDSQDPDRPTFVWVHLFDPHAPYSPPEPEASLYDHPYDGAIAHSDRVVGTLLEGYEKRGRYDDALIVVTADHGESLGEHGEVTHGVFVYDSTVRIPLVMRGPGLSSDRPIAQPVALVDVFPTVLSLMGLQIPEDIDGVNLVPLLTGKAAGRRESGIYLESYYSYYAYGWSPLRGLRTNEFKLIVGVAPELYHLLTDPGEMLELSSRRPRESARLATRLEAIAPSHLPIAEGTLDLDEETRARLSALGYVSADSKAPQTDVDLLDPRTEIAELDRLNRAWTLELEGNFEAAIGILREAARDEPRNTFAWSRLALVERAAGQWNSSAESFMRVAQLQPHIAHNQEYLGVALEAAGRLEEAVEAYGRALAIEPRRPSSRSHRWRLLKRLGRLSNLEAELEGLVAKDTEDGQALERLIRLRHRDRPRAQLIEALEAARAKNAGLHEITAALALALYQEGNRERAETLFRLVLESEPGHFNASFVVGEAALQRGNVEEARSILEAAAREYNEHVPILWLLAKARKQSGDLEAAIRAIEDAIQLRPREASLWLTYADISFERKRWAESVHQYRKAAELGVDESQLKRNLSEALRRLEPGAQAESSEAKIR
jgi:arylsulfatase A-like enzyme/Flp pilus assembly protein TadD